MQHATDYRRTKRLYWEPTYQPGDSIYPPQTTEGIHFNDWDRWDDPFQMNYRQYVELQAKKDQGFHPVRDFFDRYGGTNRIDPRWIEGTKILYPTLLMAEYGPNRTHARTSRYAPAPALRAAAFYQSFDELRHAQNHVYQIRMLNKHSEGFNNWSVWRRRHFLLRPVRLLFEDILACTNVFEAIMGLNFLIEVGYTNIVLVGIPSAGVINGDTSLASEMLTTQSDETRHMAIGQSTIKTLLEADERNLEPLQYWFDKYFWLVHRVAGCGIGVLPDYFARNKAMSMKQMFTRYVAENFVNGLVEDLGRYGFRPPRFLDDALIDMEDASHSVFRTMYQLKHVLFNKVFVPTARDFEFFNSHYPHFEERHGRFWQEVADGDPKDVSSLPMICQMCQLPCIFPTPENPTIRSSEWNNELWWFCSDGCKWIFDHEPLRYSRSVTLDRLLTGKDPGQIREYSGLDARLGGVLDESEHV